MERSNGAFDGPASFLTAHPPTSINAWTRPIPLVGAEQTIAGPDEFGAKWNAVMRLVGDHRYIIRKWHRFRLARELFEGRNELRLVPLDIHEIKRNAVRVCDNFDRDPFINLHLRGLVPRSRA